MTWQRSFLFRMIVFLTFFHPDCFNNSKFEDPGPAQKENVKCITNQIEDDLMIQSLTDFSEPDKRQKNPVIERRVPEGTDFMYECRNLKKEAILKWGLYKRGVSSPSRLFSRVEVAKAKSFCSVYWASEFKASRYSGRIHVEYNTTSQCVIWILSSVTREDENIFVAAVRDNFAQGQGFRECTPVSLNVFKANTPVPTTPALQTTPVTTQKPGESVFNQFLITFSVTFKYLIFRI
ncbi:uncharacterized protein LOC116287854 [Actinia tenebrosa]|uniref:Uncharacterized protein LOC116287854 n=1 Tax=Actinia tenebrosa TaxID=6105 RepID=A0A6P8H4D2_ACTTE|nr:uncharacterized protein LOC116287854 [Actinia tenebrosa]